MSDDRQIFVPESFIQLFQSGRHGRLKASRDEIESRYEWCEDLAQTLIEPSKETFWALNLDESTVLERTLRGLQESSTPELAGERAWVVRRLCELLDWPPEACPASPDLPCP